ncbi:MAG: SURF1 family protein [Phenylobacterium sp.]|uniref:SURF1 family protein n=1 Tax=Phenylobacterium sp. TaxID=1871053 RepID=UPI001A5A37EF|nr:SURF1 family cytochrome oxidase biogenesis protein [Phenylobacterium sp.]MBL8553096.1 SURF1 family protein [Phenylobacterium sp.]
MTTEAHRRFPVGLTVATAIAFAILMALGTWQVQRLRWKEDLLARIAALQAAEPQALDTVLARVSNGGDGDFTRVEAVCAGLASAPYLELYSVRDGQAGSRLISACRVAGGRSGSILVDRGFVADTVSARPPVDAAATAPMAIFGVLRKPETGNLFSPQNTPERWYTRDVAAMAAALKAPEPAPLFLMAETSSNPEWKALVPAPIPADIPNRHLEYALTWYGLAAALLGVYAALLLKRRKA